MHFQVASRKEAPPVGSTLPVLAMCPLAIRERSRLLRQLPAHVGDAQAGQRLVAHEPQGEVDQVRRERSSATAAMSPSRWPRSPFRDICSPTSCR
jgi:hypothetical protein